MWLLEQWNIKQRSSFDKIIIWNFSNVDGIFLTSRADSNAMTFTIKLALIQCVNLLWSNRTKWMNKHFSLAIDESKLIQHTTFPQQVNSRNEWVSSHKFSMTNECSKCWHSQRRMTKANLFPKLFPKPVCLWIKLITMEWLNAVSFSHSACCNAQRDDSAVEDDCKNHMRCSCNAVATLPNVDETLIPMFFACTALCFGEMLRCFSAATSKRFKTQSFHV